MARLSNTRWILLFALLAMWILIIQIMPRFLPFSFDRLAIAGIMVHTDYLTHVLLFVAIVLIVNLLRLKIRGRYLLPLILVAAVVAEVVQLYIPKRTFNYWDLVSKIAGVFIGFVAMWIVRNARKADKNVAGKFKP